MYKHGNYVNIGMNEVYAQRSSGSHYAPVYVGALPVHTAQGGSALVNTPVVLTDFEMAAKTVGYTDDWENYDLCEAIYAHFALVQAGPIVVINVFDPMKSKKSKTATVAASNNQAVIGSMGGVILDSVKVEGKEQGVDYSLAYDYVAERLTLRGLRSNALVGSLSITYDEVTPGVTQADVIGETDDEGMDTGLYLMRRVYQETGKIPSRLLCPGFSHIPAVHRVMETVSSQIGGRFDIFIQTDLPLESEDTPLKPSAVTAWKESNGYSCDNEKTHWPRWAGNDGRLYHLSVLEAANLQRLENDAGEIPYQTASNTAIPVGGRPYYGENSNIVLDEQLVNETLGQYGVASCIFHGGSWVLWGAHCASYLPGNVTALNLQDSALMMMYYFANDFQVRRAEEIDKVASINRIKQIVAEEQARLDALVAIGALLYGKASFVTNDNAKSDMLTGDFALRWEITRALNIKSITGTVQHTQEGFTTFYNELMALSE